MNSEYGVWIVIRKRMHGEQIGRLTGWCCRTPLINVGEPKSPFLGQSTFGVNNGIPSVSTIFGAV